MTTAEEQGRLWRGSSTLALHYPDLDTFVRRVASAGPMVGAAEAHGAAAVADAVRAAAAPFRRADGSVRLENEWRYLVSRASSRSALTTAPDEHDQREA